MKQFGTLKNALLSSVIFFSFYPAVFGQSNNKSFQVADRLKTFFSSNSIENAYLQFDKPYYAAGDTIYFKAYVTEGERHQLSALSEVLHIDLINPENNIDQSIKLLLNQGVSWGDFALPDSLAAGNYRVRAYTQWMRNRGESDFFERSIPIGSFLKSQGPENTVNQLMQESSNKADIQFFPEGGSLVTGINTKVAFKAIGTNGLSIHVRGVVLDNDNKVVCSFSSAHLGMGYFFLNPAYGQTYKARITFGDSSKEVVDLPRQQISGISLSVNYDQDSKVSFIIEANAAWFKINKNKDFILVIYSGGKAITYPFNQDVHIITFDLERRLLQTDVAMVTLFSAEGEPLCERLFFVQNNDQLGLHLEADTTPYKKREGMKLVFDAKDWADSSVTGHFSVSVTDESKVPEDENNERNILTDLLITSSVAGYVEQPNYYFNNPAADVFKNLDILMLTQGYRSFEWKQVLDTNHKTLAFQHEAGLEISGRVTNLFGKPIANATVTLIPFRGDTTLTTLSDNKGLFHFSKVAFTDTIHIILSAVNSKGNNSTKIIYIEDKDEPAISVNEKTTSPIVNNTVMTHYLDNAKNYMNEKTKYSFGKPIVLKEVKVKGKGLDNQYRTQSLAGAGNADQVMHADEIEQISGELGTSLNGRLRGLQFRHDPLMGSGDYPYMSSPPGDGPMVVVIDGEVTNMVDRSGNLQPVDIDIIPSSLVESVEVLKFASASMYGMGGGNGVLIITTKQGNKFKDNSAPNGILSIAPVGFYKARTFYSPKYDPANINSTRTDLRSTIYWNPEIQTGKDGKASFDYFNADGTGTYKVTIEGIDTNGNIGRLEYRYKVE
jgi:TonB-dependent SusC/RagA subfamily outer membrane receptor